METSNPTVGRQGNPLVIKVKALLMRAWRERWNEVQWGIQLKRVMTSTPGDSKDLAGNVLTKNKKCNTFELQRKVRQFHSEIYVEVGKIDHFSLQNNLYVLNTYPTQSAQSVNTKTSLFQDIKYSKNGQSVFELSSTWMQN